MEQAADLGPVYTDWPCSSRTDWRVRTYWYQMEGRAECVGIAFFKGCDIEEDGSVVPLNESTMPGRVRASDLRGIPIAELIDRSRRGNAGRLRELAESPPLRDFRERSQTPAVMKASDAELNSRLAAAYAAQAEPFVARPKLGGRYPDEYWRSVIEVYSDAWDAGLNPTKEVAVAFRLPYSTATKHVARAKKEVGVESRGRGRPGLQRSSAAAESTRISTRSEQ